MILGIDYGANNVQLAWLDHGEILETRTMQRVRGQRLLNTLHDALHAADLDKVMRSRQVVVGNSTTLLYPTHRDGLDALEKELLGVFSASDILWATAEMDLISMSEWTSIPPYKLIGTNFVGSAYYAASLTQNGVVVDIGTSSTDVIAIVNGTPICAAWEHPAFNRLATNELWMVGGIHTYCEMITHRVPWRGLSTPIVPGVVRMIHVLYELQLIDSEYVQRELGHAYILESRKALSRVVGYDYDFVSTEERHAIASYILEEVIRHVREMVEATVHHFHIVSPNVVPLGFSGAFIADRLPYTVVAPPEVRREPLSAVGLAQLAADRCGWT